MSKNLQKKYKLAKEAKVGQNVICPSFNTSFVKTSYQQVFCKSKSGTQCKDYYWNNTTPEKKCNTTRISPASAAYMASQYGNEDQRIADREDRQKNELNSDPSWDAHQCHVERCEWCGYINCRCED